jgi:hypothetical protein
MMSKLVWNDIGEKFYETGIDRGVLTFSDIFTEVIPWNGLISITESPSGGDPKPYYIDGVKYLNISAYEDFEATLTALSAPFEFNECDGIGQVANGLFISEQPRKRFNLCYRTKIGNDVDGLDAAYKLHFVYNVLATATSRNNQTLTDSTDPMVLSWKLTSVPAVVSEKNYTSHLIIDSREIDQSLLAYIEGVLYGGKLQAPFSFYTSPLYIGLFANIWNLVPLPGPMTYQGSLVQTTQDFTNLVTDPRGTSPWAGYGSQAITPVTNISDHPLGITTANRVTYATNQNNPGVIFPCPVVTGTAYVISAWIKFESSSPGNAIAFAQSSITTSPPITPLPTVWTRVSWVYTASGGNPFGIRVSSTSGGGGSYLVTGVQIEKTTVLHNYFDGDIPLVQYNDELLVPSWVGAENASASKFTYITNFPSPDEGDVYMVNGYMWGYFDGFWKNYGLPT